ncbi:MAG: TIGR03905 family TSCPD domain-containing protein [Firmicutes bacterium]|nr:TIGR03905 family TSCPD domain-containing protein [Bacillota bacterium]
MKKVIKTHNICAREIEYELDNGVVKNVRFIGGCAGNGYGIANLVEGMPIDEVVKRLKGVPCRLGTSCPDQLAKALEEESK